MTEILTSNQELISIIEENDESTLIAEVQESNIIVEMEPGVPGESGLDYDLESITGDITAVDGKMYLVDCTGGDVTITI